MRGAHAAPIGGGKVGKRADTGLGIHQIQRNFSAAKGPSVRGTTLKTAFGGTVLDQRR